MSETHDVTEPEKESSRNVLRKTEAFGVFGIRITSERDRSNGEVVFAELARGIRREKDADPDMVAELDGLETLLISHFAAGVDVFDERYRLGFKAAVECVKGAYG